MVFCLKHNKYIIITIIIIIIIIIIIKLLITSYLSNRMSRKIITMKKKIVLKVLHFAKPQFMVEFL